MVDASEKAQKGKLPPPIFRDSCFAVLFSLGKDMHRAHVSKGCECGYRNGDVVNMREMILVKRNSCKVVTFKNVYKINIIFRIDTVIIFKQILFFFESNHNVCFKILRGFVWLVSPTKHLVAWC